MSETGKDEVVEAQRALDKLARYIGQLPDLAPNYLLSFGDLTLGDMRAIVAAHLAQAGAAEPSAWLKPKPDPLACYDCGLRYGGPGWMDAVVDTSAWVKISPTGHEGGILCITCMARRCEALKLDDVSLRITSGPFVSLTEDKIWEKGIRHGQILERDAALEEAARTCEQLATMPMSMFGLNTREFALKRAAREIRQLAARAARTTEAKP